MHTHCISFEFGNAELAYWDNGSGVGWRSSCASETVQDLLQLEFELKQAQVSTLQSIFLYPFLMCPSLYYRKIPTLRLDAASFLYDGVSFAESWEL